MIWHLATTGIRTQPNSQPVIPYPLTYHLHSFVNQPRHYYGNCLTLLPAANVECGKCFWCNICFCIFLLCFWQRWTKKLCYLLLKRRETCLNEQTNVIRQMSYLGRQILRSDFYFLFHVASDFFFQFSAIQILGKLLFTIPFAVLNAALKSSSSQVKR